MNLAEGKQYDERFPAHLVSRLRRMMELQEPRLHITDEMKALPPFKYPPEEQLPNVLSKLWWKRWLNSSSMILG